MIDTQYLKHDRNLTLVLAEAG